MRLSRLDEDTGISRSVVNDIQDDFSAILRVNFTDLRSHPSVEKALFLNWLLNIWSTLIYIMVKPHPETLLLDTMAYIYTN